MEREHRATTTTTVCVTGASGFIGSWLVMRLLQRGYYVSATVRDLGNEKEVKHLVELPNASTHLSLWKADLEEEGSFDDAIQGCQGVFHVASPMEFISSKDPEMYFVGKTMAEKAAWKYAEENGLDLVTIHPSLVIGPFLTPFTVFSIDVAVALYTRNEVLYPLLKQTHAVHVDDLCNAHIYLFEHPLAKGRYICSSHNFNMFELAKSLSLKYPESDIPIELEGFDKSHDKVIPCLSKKLMDLGFQFAYKDYNAGDLCAEAIESCREKGLLSSSKE